MQTRAVSLARNPAGIYNVLENRHGEGIGFLEDHAQSLSQADDIDSAAVDVVAVEHDSSLGMDVVDQVVHAVDASEQSRFSAAAGADQRRHLLRGDGHA